MSPERSTSTHIPRASELTEGARRILTVASELFYRQGIHQVGVDTIAAESGVTKRTLYNRFGSKEILVAAYLQARHDTWWDRMQNRLRRETGPRVLAVFDAYFADSEGIDRGCAFINASAELPAGHPGRHVIQAHKDAVRAQIAELIREDHPELPDPEHLADVIFLLLEGAVSRRGIHRDDDLTQTARAACARILSGSSPAQGRPPALCRNVVL